MDAGLEKIVAAQTILSDVNGQEGRLTIRGHDVENLARERPFEEIVHLLWSGFFEGLPEPEALAANLGATRVLAFEQISPHIAFIAKMPDMEGLRLATSLVPDGDDLTHALRLLATCAISTAATSRARRGQPPIAPNPALSHGDDFIRMITSTDPSPSISRGINAYFATVAEHGLNASTFAARVVASTKAGLTSAVIAGICALKGPLHGGAPGPVLDMLDAIGRPENAESWIRDALDRNERLMGFGHRVYKVRDPRADALKAAVLDMPTTAGRLALAEKIEQVILEKLAIEKPDRNLETNVEYYTAILLEALDIPRTDFSCVFACARAAGWVAHAKEQLSTKRIIRPMSVYVGPAPAA